jgi:UDP-glucose:(heptosyl)LPS alpha-1,3-glucosyltransferase
VNVAFVIENLDPSRGGAETYVARFARTLVKGGHEVAVYTAEAEREIDGVTLVRVPLRGFTARARVLNFDRDTTECLLAADHDVVMAVGNTSTMDVFQPHGGTYSGTLEHNALKVSSRAGRALARRLRRLSPKRQALLEIERRQYDPAKSRLFVALSRMVERHMKRYHNVPDERIRVVYNGVDTERFHPGLRDEHREAARRELEIGPEEVAVLIVAHNPGLKGLGQLIRAMGLVADRGHKEGRLIVVGRSRAKRRYWNEAYKVGLANRVHFVGPTREVERYYGAADLYCQPTFYDPCSLVVLEALAAGLPVVTSVYNGASELITEGVEGSIIQDPHDVSSLADVLAHFWDPETRLAAGEAARKLALEHTLQTNYREMMRVFDEALAAKSGRPGRGGITP